MTPAAALRTCYRCGERSEALDGASLPAEAGLCELCRQRERNARGACPNCARRLVEACELNPLTGKPRRDANLPGAPSRVLLRCEGCGYERRPR